MDVAAIALHYKNSCKFLGIDVVFYGEGKDDVIFWSEIFRENLPEKKFEMYFYTKANEGTISGKNAVLQYQPFTDEQFMLCVDSDYDYLLNKPNHTVHEGIFQTYTYSIENYRCFPSGLMPICRKAAHSEQPNIFDVENFIQEYSRIIYPLFIRSLMFAASPKTYEMKDFLSDISLPQHFLINKIEDYLKDLSSKVQDKLKTFNFAPEKFAAFDKTLKSNNLSEENTYLLIQGHALQNRVIKPLLNSIVYSLKNLKYEKHKTTEAKKIYETKLQDVGELLNVNMDFYACKLFAKIKNDIEIYKQKSTKV
jgi:hypothetical protein